MNESELTDRQRFQVAVADALARWQIVEINLQAFFVAVIDAPDSRWSAAAYNAVTSLRGKIDMLNEILKWRLPAADKVSGTDIPAEWEILKQSIFKGSRERNYLVHWTFIATYTKEKPKEYTYVVTPFGDTRKDRTNRQLTESDLGDMAQRFGVLQNQVVWFHQKIMPLLAPPGMSGR